MRIAAVKNDVKVIQTCNLLAQRHLGVHELLGSPASHPQCSVCSQAEQKRTTLQLAMKDQKLAQMRNVVRELEGKLADALKRGTDV